MDGRRIEFLSDGKKEKYLEQVFKRSHIYYEKTIKNDKAEFVFVCDKVTESCILCSLICTFYKFNELLKAFSPEEEPNSAFCALIGALVGFDSDEDLKKVSDAVRNNEISNVDGFYNFCIPQIKKDWRGLARLAVRLYSQCNTSEEILALCIFMMGIGDDRIGDTIVISPEKELYSESDRSVIAVLPFFDDSNKDMIVTLMSNHPEDVVVADPSSLPAEVMSVIKGLAQ